MKCGDFPRLAKHQIVIQKRIDSSTDYGGTTTTWQNLATVWAIIEPTTGNDPFADDQIQSRVTSKMIIRYRSDMKNTAVSGKYKILFDDREFPIRYVKNVDEDLKYEGNSFQVIVCEENYAENTN